MIRPTPHPPVFAMRGARYIAAAMLLAACGRGAAATPLEGRWERGTDRVEFFGGGTVVLHRHHLSGAGEYDFVEPDRVVVRFGPPFDGANVGDYRVRVQGDTARLCETSRPHRCMVLVRSRSDWVEGSGIHVIGDVADLRPVRPAEDAVWHDPDKPRRREMVDAALDAMVALTVEAASRPDPDDQLSAKLGRAARRLRGQ